MSDLQKIVVSRKYLATLQRNTTELTALYNNGVMDWEGYEEIDWDSV